MQDDSVTLSGRTSAPSFTAVRQQVRRFRPSDLIPALAKVACEISDPGPDVLQRWRTLSPWGLAALARESVVRGNEFRNPRAVSDDDVRELHNWFNASYDPGPTGEKDRALGIMARHAYEQFPYQESDGQELARTWALLEYALPHAETLSLDSAALEGLVAGPLKEALRATWLLYGSTQAAEGRWAPTWWQSEAAEAVGSDVSAQSIVALAEDLTADVEALQANHATVEKPAPHLLRWDYNPLARYPLVTLADGQVIAPQPRLVVRRMSPGGLYYVGIDRVGPRFPEDLGRIVEQYVGLTLSGVEDTAIEGEILYDKGQNRSIDWFWQYDDVLVLVEVKSMRATLGARTGSPDFAPTLAKRLNEAVNQLKSTAMLIDEGRREFRHLSRHACRIGLIVTAEPIYMGNASALRSYLASAPFPILVVSLRDLERLVAYSGDQIFDALPAIANDPELSTWLLSSALAAVLEGVDPDRQAPLIERALADLDPFAPSGREEEQ